MRPEGLATAKQRSQAGQGGEGDQGVPHTGTTASAVLEQQLLQFRIGKPTQQKSQTERDRKWFGALTEGKLQSQGMWTEEVQDGEGKWG